MCIGPGDAGFKWIVDEKTGATQVFALATDPHELRDVAGTRRLAGSERAMQIGRQRADGREPAASRAVAKVPPR